MATKKKSLPKSTQQVRKEKGLTKVLKVLFGGGSSSGKAKRF